MSGALMLRGMMATGIDTWVPDDWKARGISEGSINRMLNELTTNAIPWDVNNVVTYLDSLGNKKRDEMQLADLPCVAPPFPKLWMEFRRPIQGDWLLWDRWNDVNSIGVFFRSFDLKDDDIRQEYEIKLPAASSDNARFAVDASLFLELNQNVRDDIPTRFTGPVLQIMTVLDEFGGWSCHENSRARFTVNPVSPLITDWYDQITDSSSPDFARKAISLISREFMLPAFFAISLAHCSNVSIVENQGLYRSRQERRLAERRGEPKAIKFYTLEIGGITKTLNDEGGAKSNGLKKALHICRGHFSTYSEEKPLFGKYSGRFWIPAHVRGSAEAGKVVKDYSVKAPRSDAA